MKLHQLLQLTPPRMTRDEKRALWWRIAALTGWGLVYLIAILAAGMEFVD